MHKRSDLVKVCMPDLRRGDLVRVHERCFGENDDGREVWVEAESLARVYHVQGDQIGVSFPNGVTAVFDSGDDPMYPLSLVERGAPPEQLHPATAKLVDDFAAALKAKLLVAQTKHGWSVEWKSPAWRERCLRELARHVEKGDPRDVAAYAAFCWYHNWPTAES